MSVVVTDDGFEPDQWDGRVLEMEDLQVSETAGHAVNFPVDGDVEELRPFIDRLAMVCIPFASFADGRGFSIAQRLRLMGFKGVLRAVGDIVSDQYKHARKVGFDQVVISDDLAKRQPEVEWIAAAGWAKIDYRDHLRSAG